MNGISIYTSVLVEKLTSELSRWCLCVADAWTRCQREGRQPAWVRQSFRCVSEKV